MKIIFIIWLATKFAKSLIFEQHDSKNFNRDDIVHEEEGIPSKTACIQRCLYSKADALYTNDKRCRCVINKEFRKDGESKHTVNGTYLKLVGNKNKLVIQKSIQNCNENRTTWNFDGKTVYHLDRHRVECIKDNSNTILSAFTLDKTLTLNKGEFREDISYSYKCCTFKWGCHYGRKETPRAQVIGSVQALKHLNVKCDVGILSSFVLRSHHNKNEISYKYECCVPNKPKPVSCIEKEARHFKDLKVLGDLVGKSISCPPNYGLTGFRLSAQKMKYEYQCCMLI